VNRAELVAALARVDQCQKSSQAAGPGGQWGTTLLSSVTDLTPNIDSSDKPLPGPASPQPKRCHRLCLDTNAVPSGDRIGWTPWTHPPWSCDAATAGDQAPGTVLVAGRRDHRCLDSLLELLRGAFFLKGLALFLVV